MADVKKRIGFNDVFKVRKPIVGMIHLYGKDNADRVAKAIREVEVYQNEGVDGIIVEDYAPGVVREDVEETLKQMNGRRIIKGVNYLRNPIMGFTFSNNYGGSFVQFDSVEDAGIQNMGIYEAMRRGSQRIIVLGGVRFKYQPESGNSLEYDLNIARQRCDAVVTTGDGTGIETPIEKLKEFRRILGDFPLIVGAGVNSKNVLEQLAICDGAIIGSSFKFQGKTEYDVDRNRVKEIMSEVRRLRANVI